MGEVSDLDSSKDSLQIKYIREDIPEVEVPVYKGERNTAFIPDTLDLQERAGLAVNGLTGPRIPMPTMKFTGEYIFYPTHPSCTTVWTTRYR